MNVKRSSRCREMVEMCIPSHTTAPDNYHHSSLRDNEEIPVGIKPVTTLTKKTNNVENGTFLMYSPMFQKFDERATTYNMPDRNTLLDSMINKISNSWNFAIEHELSRTLHDNGWPLHLDKSPKTCQANECDLYCYETALPSASRSDFESYDLAKDTNYLHAADTIISYEQNSSNGKNTFTAEPNMDPPNGKNEANVPAISEQAGTIKVGNIITAQSQVRTTTTILNQYLPSQESNHQNVVCEAQSLQCTKAGTGSKPKDINITIHERAEKSKMMKICRDSSPTSTLNCDRRSSLHNNEEIPGELKPLKTPTCSSDNVQNDTFFSTAPIGRKFDQCVTSYDMTDISTPINSMNLVHQPELSYPDYSILPLLNSDKSPKPSQTNEHDLCCYETTMPSVSRSDFDSDDSVKDKDYLPMSDTAKSSEQQDSSDEENELTVESTTCSSNGQKVANAPETTEQAEISHNLNITQSQVRPTTILNQDLTSHESIDQNGELEAQSLQYTKAGTVRKRKKFDTSVQERAKNKRERIQSKYQVKPGCDDKCTKKCTQLISENDRIKINQTYGKMTWNERRIFIQNNSCVIEPKRKISTEGQRHPRRTYSLKIENKKIEVCKIFFLTTLGFNKNNDKVLYNSLTDEPHTVDMRGKHTKTPSVDRDVITKHVESFHPKISHYRREHAPQRRYLPSEINIKYMFEDFCENHPSLKVSYDLYRKHVKSMNISFAQLGNEECETCETHNIHCKNEMHDKTNIPENCKICEDWISHKDRYVKARKLYAAHREEKNNEIHIYFSTDLEKVIMLPRMDTFKKVIFCPRLVVYNQTFAPLGKCNVTNKTYAVLWHDALAGRKQMDIMSAFNNFFVQYRDYKFVDLWLDNCSAQNKNWLLFSYLVNLVNSETTSAEKITLNFFEPGHTFMSCDHFHHQVELSMKKKGKIYDFKDFVETVSKASSGKVVVKEMMATDFINVLDHTSSRRIQNTYPRPYIKDIVQASFKRSSFNLFYKTDFEGEDTELCFLKNNYIKNLGKTPTLSFREFPKGITQERKHGILTKISCLMPPHKLLFWKNLPTNSNADNSDDE